MAESDHTWPQAAIHSILGTTSLLQAVWPLAECPDAALLPLLAFRSFVWPMSGSGTQLGRDVDGTQGHNWFVAQYGTTWRQGCCFPSSKASAQYQAFFPTYFEREMRLLLFPDGFTHELLVSYHRVRWTCSSIARALHSSMACASVRHSWHVCVRV